MGYFEKNTKKNLGGEFAKVLASAQEVARAASESAGVSGGVASSFSVGAAMCRGEAAARRAQRPPR